MDEPQKRKRLRFALSPLLPAIGRISAKFNQPGFLIVDFQTKLPKPLLECCQKLFGLCLMLEPHNEIVGVAHDDNVTMRDLLPPSLHP